MIQRLTEAIGEATKHKRGDFVSSDRTIGNISSFNCAAEWLNFQKKTWPIPQGPILSLQSAEEFLRIGGRGHFGQVPRGGPSFPSEPLQNPPVSDGPGGTDAVAAADGERQESLRENLGVRDAARLALGQRLPLTHRGRRGATGGPQRQDAHRTRKHGAIFFFSFFPPLQPINAKRSIIKCVLESEQHLTRVSVIPPPHMSSSLKALSPKVNRDQPTSSALCVALIEFGFNTLNPNSIKKLGLLITGVFPSVTRISLKLVFASLHVVLYQILARTNALLHAVFHLKHLAAKIGSF